MSISSLVEAYPVVLLIVSSLSGILLFSSVPPYVKILSFAGLAASVLFSRRNKVRAVLVVAAFSVSGIRYAGRMEGPAVPPPRGKRAIEGRILNFPYHTLSGTEVAVLGAEGVKGKVLLRWKHPLEDLWGGERVRVEARIEEPRNMKNPGGFDYVCYLRRKGILYTSWVRGRDLEVIKRSCGILVGIRKRLWSMSQHIKDTRKRGIYLSLVLGERRMLPPSFEDNIRKLGLSHIFAISGLHLVLVFYFFMRLFMFFLSRSRRLLELGVSIRWSHLMAFFPTSIYAYISGFSIPTKRALFGLAIYTLLFLMKKRKKVLHAVLGAMLFQLILFPWDVGSLSFVLSFSAVFSILLAVRIHRALGAESKMLLFVLVTVSPFFFTLPLQIMFFYRIPLYAPIANMVIVPMVGGFTIPILIASSFGYLAIPSNIFSKLSEIAVSPLLLADYASKLPHTTIQVVRKDVMVAFVLVALSLLLFIRGNWKRILVLFSSLLVAAWAFWGLLGGGSLEVYFLDVGRGNAVVVKGPKGNAVIDFGPNSIAGKGLWRVVRYLNIRKIDVAILTSRSNACSGGLGAFLKLSDPRKFYFPSFPLERDVIMAYQAGRTRFLKVRKKVVVEDVGVPMELVPCGSELVVVVRSFPSLVISGKGALRAVERLKGVVPLAPSIVGISRGKPSGMPKKALSSLEPVAVIAGWRGSFPARPGIFTTGVFGCIKVSLGKEGVVVSALYP